MSKANTVSISADRNGLAAALSRAASVVLARGPINYSQVLMEVDPERSVITGANPEVAVRAAWPDCMVKCAAKFTVKPSELSQFLASVPNDELEIEWVGAKLRIRSGRGSLTVPTGDAGAFQQPTELTVESDAAETRMATSDLHLALRRTAFAVGEGSGALGGLQVEFSGPDVFRAVATDGRRLAVAEVPARCRGSQLSALLPVSVAKAALRTIDPDGETSIVVSDDRFVMWSASTTVWGRLAEGRFPKWQNIVNPGPLKATLPADSLLHAVRMAAITTNHETSAVEFEFIEEDGDTVLKVTSESPEIGDSRFITPVKHDFGGMALDDTPILRLDPRYMTPAIDAMGENPVAIHIKDNKSAVVFRVPGYDYVVMPLTPHE